MAQWSRRRFLQIAGAATGAGLLGWRLPADALPTGLGSPGAGTSSATFLRPQEIATLNAALARLIPASAPGDWSAADLGVATYIDMILSAFTAGASSPPLFAGGPYRSEFQTFQALSRVKSIGWRDQVKRWQELYRAGLARLDLAAGGNFVTALPQLQDAILEELDLSGDAFFTALYDHTMEGTYSHPVYGGNAGYRSWKAVGFAGDVHGVRFPSDQYSRGAWNVYGGYAPEEIIAVGSAATEQPVTAAAPAGPA